MKGLLFVFLFCYLSPKAQFLIGGTVYDVSKLNYVENVRVVSSSGLFAISDSMGRYKIYVTEKDSLTFIYNNKSTQKFLVSQIGDPEHFDISLHIKVKSKYSVLKEVTVFSKTFQQDSIENRLTYADVFNFSKPSIQTGISADGVAGFDLDALFNMFKFKRNKMMLSYQKRLEQEEKEKSEQAMKDQLTTYSENDVTYYVNECGFRGDWKLGEQNDNVLGVFGCSFTYGIGTAEQDLFSSLIANHLNCQAFNFGVPGGSFNRACRYYSVVSKYQKFKYVIFVIPHIGRLEFPKYKDKVLTTMNIIPNWVSKNREDEKFREKVYSVFDDDYLKFDTLRNLEHAISISQHNNTKIYFSSWDIPTYDLIHDFLGADSNMLLPWFQFNRDVSIVPRARDGDHPGLVCNHQFYERSIPYLK